MRLRVVLFFLCAFPVGGVAPIAAQDEPVRYGDWLSHVVVDAMTDSVIGRRAWVFGDPRTLTSQPVLRVYCDIFDPTADSYIFFLVLWTGRDHGIPEGENVLVRFRVDGNVASDWWDWRAMDSGEFAFVGVDHERAQRLLGEMKVGRTILIRYRVPGSPEEKDVEFSLSGFTQALAATCDRN
jgi:hypothetical protein